MTKNVGWGLSIAGFGFAVASWLIGDVDMIPSTIRIVGSLLGVCVLLYGVVIIIGLQFTLGRPKLTRRLHCQQGPSEDCFAKFTVQSRSLADMVDCEFDLVQIVRNGEDYDLQAPVALLWSEGHKDPMRMGDEREQRKGKRTIEPFKKMTVDLARTEEEKNTIKFETQDAKPLHAPTGNYEVYIRLHGKYGRKQFESNFGLSFTYKGGKQFSCDRAAWNKMKIKYVNE